MRNLSRRSSIAVLAGYLGLSTDQALAQNSNQAELDKAQNELRAVLTSRPEAIAALSGLL